MKRKIDLESDPLLKKRKIMHANEEKNDNNDSNGSLQQQQKQQQQQQHQQDENKFNKKIAAFSDKQDQTQFEVIFKLIQESQLVKSSSDAYCDDVIKEIAFFATGYWFTCLFCEEFASFLSKHIKRHLSVECIKCKEDIWNYYCDIHNDVCTSSLAVGPRCDDCHAKVCVNCYKSCRNCQHKSCIKCNNCNKDCDNCSQKKCNRCYQITTKCTDCVVVQPPALFFKRWEELDDPLTTSSSED